MKSNSGHYFEDFRFGQEIIHATPRTVTTGDVALYGALYGGRFAVASSSQFARAIGFPDVPVDDFLTFHIVFGKTVPDISLNAVANLGYAEGRFGEPVFAGDTLRAVSRVIGLKENSSGQTGVVYVRSTGYNQNNAIVVDFVRWVMVRKRDPSTPPPEAETPRTDRAVDVKDFVIPESLDLKHYDRVLAGSPHMWDDYVVGESIDHLDGMTIEESDHMLATRLYQNTARIHFNQHQESQGRFGRRLIYGGHIISLARALSFNGLGNAFKVVAINGGRHVTPTFGGDTIYAWSQIDEKIEIPGRHDVGALRLRTVATKDFSCASYPFKGTDGRSDHPSVVLELDYTVLMPRRR